MKTTWREIFCVMIILVRLHFSSGAQFIEVAQTNIPKYQFGLSVGTFVYQGDLTPDPLGSYRTLRPVINLFGSKFLSPSFALRGNLAFGSLHGDDAAYDHPEYRRERNFNFHSPLLETSAIAEWSILRSNFISHGFAPYVFAGGALTFLHIHRDYSNLNAEYFGTNSDVIAGLNRDLQHSPPTLIWAIPVGVGVRYYFSDKIGISAETTYRIMSNDYLDGFSYAANPAHGDHYYSHTIGVVYRIGKKNTLDCPGFK